MCTLSSWRKLTLWLHFQKTTFTLFVQSLGAMVEGGRGKIFGESEDIVSRDFIYYQVHIHLSNRGTIMTFWDLYY